MGTPYVAECRRCGEIASMDPCSCGYCDQCNRKIVAEMGKTEKIKENICRALMVLPFPILLPLLIIDLIMIPMKRPFRLFLL